MLILPKIKFRRDPNEPEEEFDEELEEEPGEASEEEFDEEPEEESDDKTENEIEEETDEKLEHTGEVTVDVSDEEDFTAQLEEVLREGETEESQDTENPSHVTEAVPIPEKEKKVRKKKPKKLLCYAEEPEGIRIVEMLGTEEQQTLFVPFVDEPEEPEEPEHPEEPEEPEEPEHPEEPEENEESERSEEAEEPEASEESPATESEESSMKEAEEEPAEVLTPEKIGKRIKKALRKNKIRCRRAAFVIPEEESTIRAVSLPVMPEKQIRYNIPAEFREDFPDGFGGYLFDYAHVESEESETMQLITAAVPESRMERARILATSSGMKLLMAAPESLSEQSFFEEKPYRKKEKYAINFAYIGVKRMHPAVAVTIAAVLVLCALAVAKFGVIDRYTALFEAVEDFTELRDEVENGAAELASAPETQEEYAHYTWSDMTDEECEQIERIRIGALLNYIAGQGAKVKSASLSGTLLTVSVTADSLETISQLTSSIEEQDIVESCSVTTAQKEEMPNEINYAAPSSDVMEVEVDDSVPVEEITDDEEETPEDEDTGDETITEETDEAPETTSLPEVEYPEGMVEAQLRIYLKKRSDTIGAEDESEEFDAAESEVEEDLSGEEFYDEPVDEDMPEESTEEDSDEPEEDETVTDETESEEEEDSAKIVFDENGNPIVQGDAGETY